MFFIWIAMKINISPKIYNGTQGVDMLYMFPNEFYRSEILRKYNLWKWDGRFVNCIFDEWEISYNKKLFMSR